MRIPRTALMVVIVSMSIIGAFALNGGYLEIIIVLILRLIGVLFQKTGIPCAPLVLGIVLGPTVERNFMSSVNKTGWDMGQFFTGPISAILIVLTAMMLLYPAIRGTINKRTKRRRAQQAGQMTGSTPGE